MTTNGDLYEFLTALPAARRSLTDFLRALSATVAPYRAQNGLTIEQFMTVVRDALTSEPAAGPPAEPNAFEAQLWSQVDQLGRLRPRESPYDDDYVDGSDERWCNVRLGAFLEAGAAGALQGYKPEGDARVELTFLSWADLERFLQFGQYYE